MEAMKTNLQFLAQEDRELADMLWEQGKYAYAILFSQQSVEKILKAYILIVKKTTPPLSHNLVDLVQLAELSVSPVTDTALLKELSLAFVRTRYEDMSYQYYNNSQTVKPLFDFAKNIYIWIHKLLLKP